MNKEARAEALADFIENWYDRWAGPRETWVARDLAADIIEWQASREVTETARDHEDHAFCDARLGCVVREVTEAEVEAARAVLDDPHDDWPAKGYWDRIVRAALEAAREVRS